MFQAGDVLVAALPMGYYGAIKILKTGLPQHENKEVYLVGATQYFDKKKPQIDDPLLKEILLTPGPYEKYVYRIGGHKDSVEILKTRYNFLGNLPLTEAEQELDPEKFFLVPFFQQLFMMLARGDVFKKHVPTLKQEAYRLLSDESDKFFYIAYGDYYGDVSIAYCAGRAGTIGGKLTSKVFGTEEACMIEAQKLIDAKIKEGYVLATNHYRDDRGRHQFNDGKEAKSRQNKLVATHQALRYTDEKSDKFWRIEYLDSTLVVNYGKTGSIGKYQVKEFDSEEGCEKEAKKLIASKIKKGYKPYAEFDPNTHIYLDDLEVGLHRLTSHPKFREHFTDDLYYDCTDEFAPFGSDEGDISLHEVNDDLKRAVKAGTGFHFILMVKDMIEHDLGGAYPTDDNSREAVEVVLKTNSIDDMINCDMTLYSTAFAQIKTIGWIDAELKQLALNAMKRMAVVFEIKGDDYLREMVVETQTRMIRDLEGFAATP